MGFPYSISAFQKVARQALMKDEGLKFRPYPDTKGNWTIGVGHYIGPKLENQTWDFDDAMYFLDKDVLAHIEDLHVAIGEELFESLPRPRQLALLSLSFTMKRGSLLTFEDMIAAVKSGNWDQAAREVLDSKWSHDVDPKQTDGGRDNRVAFMLKTARYHPDYDL